MKRAAAFEYAALRSFARGALRASAALEEWGSSSRQHLGDFLAQLMLPEERERFSLERYSASAWEPSSAQSLPRWESEWFARALPPPPACILLAGCGSGRELLALLESGYDVVAFDGAVAPAAISRKLAAGRAPVHCGSYAELWEAAINGAPTVLSPVAERSYDAVILGWGSLTHVAGADGRFRALQACSALTEGPVLASFYGRGVVESRSGAAVKCGRAVARAWGRSLPGPDLVEFSDWGGFAEYVTREEVALHGAALGRNSQWYEGGSAPFPHVTFERKAG